MMLHLTGSGQEPFQRQAKHVCVPVSVRVSVGGSGT